MGFNIGESQMLTAPPYAGAAIIMAACAWAGDKYRVRGPLLLITAVLGLVGLPLLGYASQPGVRYFGIFLVCAAVNGGIPVSAACVDEIHACSPLSRRQWPTKQITFAASGSVLLHPLRWLDLAVLEV